MSDKESVRREAQPITYELFSGESIRLEFKASDSASGEQKHEVKQGKGWAWPSTVTKNGFMVRRPMPSDNSCLFHTVAYICQDKKQGADSAFQLRELVATVVANDPQTYNTTFLASPNHIYQQTIMNPNSWGGAIELAIFSRLFETEIVAFDFHYLREDVFGEGTAGMDPAPSFLCACVD